MDANEITAAFGTVTDLRNQAEKIQDDIESALSKRIHLWERIEPVPCGHTGGWSFGGIEDGKVILTHECFYAHRYDLHDTYSTRVALSVLAETTEQSATKAERDRNTKRATKNLRDAKQALAHAQRAAERASDVR